jgi:signal transduction histidine kinase
LQNSGATHGRLWLSEDKFDGLPESLIVYVSRSQEVVIVNESIGETPFARDAYFSSHHPRSLLCCPLVLHNRLLGVLYLENDLLSYVFSVERLKAVQLIALQAAISIEIWRQFERVQAQQLEILEERDRRNREVLRVEALQGQNRALASFLGIASHDLQTPLAVIRMWSQNFKPGISDKLLLRCRQILEQSVEQATTLIQSYLDAVVAELGQKLVLRIQSVDLTELIRSEVEFHQTSQGLPSLALSQLILEPVTADVDPLRMRQILRNLVQNALNHSSEGTYSVRLFRQDNQICLDVSNPCQPLSEEQKGRLFQAFQPGESSQGRGLGLWICRTLVEAHAGQISAVQDPGRGIVFQVRIPYQ